MEYIDVCCIVYLDDVLIYSNHLQQHRQDVSNNLEAIRISGMKVKPSKCESHKAETEYLGFIINREEIKTDPVKTQAIWDWKILKNKTNIQSFLGLCNFYQRFIEGFSRIAKPRYDRTQKKYDGKWEWTDKEQYAFDKLRRILTMVPVMIHFDPKAPIKIETDTSKYVCSGVMESTIIATIHCPDSGYCLFGTPLVTHIPDHVSCTFCFVIVSYEVIPSFARLFTLLAPCT